jgi:membrane protease YdiL (CAAX protease family)
MLNIKEFLKKERLYILLLVFVALMSYIATVSEREEKAGGKANDKAAQAATANAADGGQDAALKRAELEKRLESDRPLAVIMTLASLLILAALLLGILIDAYLLSMARSRRKLDIATFAERPPAAWNAWDVAKAVVLFFFFGYMIVLIESALVGCVPLIKNDNFRMVANSFALDALAIVFVIYFAAVQYKEKLSSLGISARNFSRNVFYGAAGYVATLPAFVLTLAVVAAVASLIRYVPEKQAVVELLMKEKDAGFLLFTGLFAAIGGPIVEELFFRGFMYGAFKKYIGIFGAMALSAAFFAALHAHAVGFFPIMVLGVALAYLYEKTGTLVAPITLHAIHNFSMMGMVFLAKQIGS